MTLPPAPPSLPAATPDELKEFGIIPLSPGLYKLDLDTPLEWFFKGLTAGAIILTVVTQDFIPVLADIAPGLEILWLLLPLLAIVGLVSLRTTQCYFLLDEGNRTLWYYRRWWFWRQTTVAARFDEIACLTATGRIEGEDPVKSLESAQRIALSSAPDQGGLPEETERQPHDYGPGPVFKAFPDEVWEYAPLVVLKTGGIITLADYRRGTHVVVNHKARLIAQVVKCGHIPCPAQAVILIQGNRTAGPVTVTHRPWPSSEGGNRNDP